MVDAAGGGGWWAGYAVVGVRRAAQPWALLGGRLAAKRCLDSGQLMQRNDGARVRAAGVASLRQRPETAHGTTFLTLEDECGNIQVIVWPDLGMRQRKELLRSRLLLVEGKWQKAEGVGNLIATMLHDLSALLVTLDVRSRDFP